MWRFKAISSLMVFCPFKIAFFFFFKGVQHLTFLILFLSVFPFAIGKWIIFLPLSDQICGPKTMIWSEPWNSWGLLRRVNSPLPSLLPRQMRQQVKVTVKNLNPWSKETRTKKRQKHHQQIDWLVFSEISCHVVLLLGEICMHFDFAACVSFPVWQSERECVL